MGSIRAFRCRECRTEILASPTLTDLRDHGAWTPPVLCCGKPLAPVDSDQVLPTMLTVRRFAWCPPCGHRVRLIVQPPGSLTCMICHGPLTGSGKSAIYQIAGLLLDGPTVVISPLR